MANKSPSILGKFVGKSCEADIHNNNDMNLSSELFDKIVASDEYKRAIKNGHYLGYLGHPEDPDCQHYQDACIVMRSMKRVGKDIEAEFDLLNTPVGKIVKTCEDAGIHFGISIRGAGDVDGEGYVNPDTFIFRGFDLVGFPAYNDCIPEFKEIAASTDAKAKSKYQKVCASIKTNLQYITSTSTLQTLQDQFKEDQPEYAMIGERIDELNAGSSDEELDHEVMQQKLDGVTQLFLEEKALNEELSEQLAQAQAENLEITASYNRKIASLKRVTANQVRDLRKSQDKIVASNTRLANQVKQLKSSKTAIESEKGKLSDRVDNLSEQNLKYRQKVIASTQTISEKDSTIDDLMTRLNETVAQSKEHKIQASNLDAQVKELQQRIAAADGIILDYQKAYANIYASALGLHLEDIPVTASTTVEQLQKVITASTSTSNIGAIPYIDDDEDDEESYVDFSDDSEDVIIL